MTNPSTTKKVRDSNMELLRVITMLLIMIIHANFKALPKPDAAAIAVAPTSAFLQFVAEGFSIRQDTPHAMAAIDKTI